MGLGFTPNDPTISEQSYPTLVDNLENYKEIKNKYFSFYLPDENGFITFGEIPSSIVSDADKINWAPLIPENENPWSVRLSDIIIEPTVSSFRFKSLNRFKTLYKHRNRRAMMFKLRRKSRKNRAKNSLSSENPCGKEGCELLIDTGTYLTYVPR